MTSLRKACHHCVASKRKCVIQFPTCTRCAEKNLPCIYDLEPLTTVRESRSLVYEFPGFCILKTLQHQSSNINPAICRSGREDTLEIIRLGYHTVPELVRNRKPAVFIHPNLRSTGSCNLPFIQSEVTYGNFETLIRLDIRTQAAHEVLTSLQSLLIYLATYLFSTQPKEESDRQLTILSEWTQTLLASVQDGSRLKRSPWQEWLFGESVRRTIIMSYVLSMSYHSFKHGYCSNWLFVESLPFDERPGLWMAETPQAWIAAAHVRMGNEVGEVLSSLHEFGENVKKSDVYFCGDVFMRLAAFGHNGISKYAKGPVGTRLDAVE